MSASVVMTARTLSGSWLGHKTRIVCVAKAVGIEGGQAQCSMCSRGIPIHSPVGLSPTFRTTGKSVPGQMGASACQNLNHHETACLYRGLSSTPVTTTSTGPLMGSGSSNGTSENSQSDICGRSMRPAKCSCFAPHGHHTVPVSWATQCASRVRGRSGVSRHPDLALRRQSPGHAGALPFRDSSGDYALPVGILMGIERTSLI